MGPRRCCYRRATCREGRISRLAEAMPGERAANLDHGGVLRPSTLAGQKMSLAGAAVRARKGSLLSGPFTSEHRRLMGGRCPLQSAAHCTGTCLQARLSSQAKSPRRGAAASLRQPALTRTRRTVPYSGAGVVIDGDGWKDSDCTGRQAGRQAENRKVNRRAGRRRKRENETRQGEKQRSTALTPPTGTRRREARPGESDSDSPAGPRRHVTAVTAAGSDAVGHLVVDGGQAIGVLSIR